MSLFYIFADLSMSGLTDDRWIPPGSASSLVCYRKDQVEITTGHLREKENRKRQIALRIVTKVVLTLGILLRGSERPLLSPLTLL